MVFGGRWLLLTERERWAEGRYLAADLLLACERNDTKRGGEVDRILAIFGCESLLPDASETIWWNQSWKAPSNTPLVCPRIFGGHSLSIEIIANDVLRRREALGLPLVEIDGADPCPPVAALLLPNPVPVIRRSLSGDGCPARWRWRV